MAPKRALEGEADTRLWAGCCVPVATPVAVGAVGATWANMTRPVAALAKRRGHGQQPAEFEPPGGRAGARQHTRPLGNVSGDLALDSEVLPGALRVVTRGHPAPVTL